MASYGIRWVAFVVLCSACSSTVLTDRTGEPSEGGPSSSGGGSATGGRSSGSGGTSNSGGTSSGGTTASTGGRSASGGVSSSGGAVNTGGRIATGGAPATGGKGSGGRAGGSGGATLGDGGPVYCEFTSTEDTYSKCVKDKCCAEWVDCGADADCSYKSEAEPGEMICIQTCLIKQLQETGITDVSTCGAQCAAGSDGVVSAATNNLVNCLTDDRSGTQACSDACFGGPI